MSQTNFFCEKLCGFEFGRDGEYDLYHCSFFSSYFSGFVCVAYCLFCTKPPHIWVHLRNMSLLLSSLNILASDIKSFPELRDQLSADVTLINLSIPESSYWCFLCMSPWSFQNNLLAILFILYLKYLFHSSSVTHLTYINFVLTTIIFYLNSTNSIQTSLPSSLHLTSQQFPHCRQILYRLSHQGNPIHTDYH